MDLQGGGRLRREKAARLGGGGVVEGDDDDDLDEGLGGSSGGDSSPSNGERECDQVRLPTFLCSVLKLNWSRCVSQRVV